MIYFYEDTVYKHDNYRNIKSYRKCEDKIKIKQWISLILVIPAKRILYSKVKL